MTKPTWEPIWLACCSCKHEWDDWQPCHVPIDTWVAHCRTYHCPKCGAGIGNILLLNKPMRAGFTDD